jgi:hypothetical protein
MRPPGGGQPVNGTGDRHLAAEVRNFSIVRAMAAAAGLQAALKPDAGFPAPSELRIVV